MIRVELPFHLRKLAHVDGEVTFDVSAAMGAPTQRALVDAIEARFPMLRRLGEADDIGATAVWLSSPEGARYIVGDVIPIDGGLLQHQ